VGGLPRKPDGPFFRVTQNMAHVPTGFPAAMRIVWGNGGRFRRFRNAGPQGKAFSDRGKFPMTMGTPAIPPGHHSLQSHFTVRDAAKAIALYRDLFGAEEIVRMLMPDGKSVMHAEVITGDSVQLLREKIWNGAPSRRWRPEARPSR
jgi:hypothetical protein